MEGKGKELGLLTIMSQPLRLILVDCFMLKISFLWRISVGPINPKYAN
jgi:hypothetical protein